MLQNYQDRMRNVKYLKWIKKNVLNTLNWQTKQLLSMQDILKRSTRKGGSCRRGLKENILRT